MRGFAAVEWDRARRTLATAEGLVKTDPDSAASRAYYAVFHALTALFALRNRAFAKHSGLRAALHRDLVRTGDLETDFGRDYDFLMDLRETADYGGMTQVDAPSADLAVGKARGLLAAVARLCPHLAANGPPP